jgi:hypothetical protein
MKVVCINNVELDRDSYGKPRHKKLPLTIGKVYDVRDSYGVDYVTFYIIEKDNNDETNTYAVNFFVTLDVWREMQLNRIL